MPRLFALVAVVLAGCGGLSRRPPTPANLVTVEELEAAEPTGPDERFYLCVFGSESNPRLPKKTHTFATFVRAVGCGPGAAVEHHTISWLPVDRDINVWRYEAEPGFNMPLHETIEFAQGQNQRVAVWGPYAIRPGLYKKLLMQKEFLDGGGMDYQANDAFGEARRELTAGNCIHAISDVDNARGRGYYLVVRFGEWASAHVVREFVRRDYILDPRATHDWLIPVLGLDRYDIVRRRSYRPTFFASPLGFLEPERTADVR